MIWLVFVYAAHHCFFSLNILLPAWCDVANLITTFHHVYYLKCIVSVLVEKLTGFIAAWQEMSWSTFSWKHVVMIILDCHSIAVRGSACQWLKRLHIWETDVPKSNCQPYFHIFTKSVVRNMFKEDFSLSNCRGKTETTTCCDHGDANVHVLQSTALTSVIALV